MLVLRRQLLLEVFGEDQPWLELLRSCRGNGERLGGDRQAHMVQHACLRRLRLWCEPREEANDGDERGHASSTELMTP